MQADEGNPLKGPNSAQKHIHEAVVAERKLWKLIQSRSPLDNEVQELYHKARLSYENSLLCHCEFAQLHDDELALWRLHYNVIDDFRKRMQADSISRDRPGLDVTHDVAIGKDKSDYLLEGFRTFLSEATEFYEKLSEKIKKCHGIAEENSIPKEACFSNIPESTTMQRCQYLCHRCSVCLGDLARYYELYANCNNKNRNWSVAACHYLNASVFWPESGNARNQLAVLAIYIGDELLAVYHCVRSLAIKEPFLNAWDNLTWLFEKNRSSQLRSYCEETAAFDFLEPCKRTATKPKEGTLINKSGCSTSGTSSEAATSGETSLWNLAVRMISLFLTKSSWEEFAAIFSSFISELEVLLSADDSELKATLESYPYIGSSANMAAHFRVLQLVSAFIFSIYILSDKEKLRDQPVSVVLALTATLICMGRLIERCTQANIVHTSPLLPAILVFLEWLIEWPDLSENGESDQKYTVASNYFSGTLVDILNRINENREISNGSPDSPYYRTTLWEDYELRGFAPLAPVHKSLHFEQGDGNNDRNGSHEDTEHQHNARIHRILVAAQKAVENRNGSCRSQKGFYYDKAERKFYLAQSNKVDSLDASLSASLEGNEQKVGEESISKLRHQPPSSNSKSIPLEKEEKVEEEEEIVFKPTARHQDGRPGLLSHGLHNQIAASGACGSSPLTRFCSNSYVAYPTTPCKESNANDSAAMPSISSDFGFPFSLIGQTTMDTSRFGITGNGTSGSQSQLDRAPSLSAWGSLGSDVEELPANLDSRLIIHGAKEQCGEGNLPPSVDYIHPVCSSTTIVGSPYSTPLPSAPPMPSGDVISSSWNGDDMIRQISATTTMLQDLMMDRKGMPNFGGATSAQLSNYLHSKWIRSTQGIPTLDPGLPWNNGYLPPFFPTRVAADGGQWLPRQWNNPYQDYSQDLSWPVGRFYPPSQLGRFQDVDVSKLAPYNSGSPWQYLACGADKEMMERYHLGGFQGMGWRHGGVVDEILERQRLLQYLKEKEWALLQQQQQQQQQGHTQIKGPS